MRIDFNDLSQHVFHAHGFTYSSCPLYLLGNCKIKQERARNRFGYRVAGLRHHGESTYGSVSGKCDIRSTRANVYER